LVVGLGLPQPIALFILSAAGKAKDPEETSNSIRGTINSINADLDSFEKIEKAVIVKDDWTIENGLMTPTLKVKRGEVEKKYQGFYEKWNNTKGTVVWE
ncbi:MAG: AMP-dependent synthetase, partial [Chitinophagales bacterium]|nr:AMP-dependent synthetase [Chitinophagales bacterium]